MIAVVVGAPGRRPAVELETAGGVPTGRWRRGQFEPPRAPNGTWLRTLPSERLAKSWRDGPVR